MKERFICSSDNMGRYLRSYIDLITPGDDCHISVKNGDFKVDNFKLPYTVPVEPQKVNLTDVWSKRQLSSLIRICSGILDQPITITIKPGEDPVVNCVLV